jgi:hypothetical protein
MALVPSPIYNIPPQLLKGEVPQVNVLVFVDVVIEHCALPLVENRNVKKRKTIILIVKFCFIKNIYLDINI